MQRRFVLLDRDGTLIVERNYLADPDQVELIPGVAEGLSELMRSGLGLLVVTNQSGVARGYFDEAVVERIHRRLVDLLASHGVRLDGIYYCPHAPEEACSCRKPRPGLVERAAAVHGFDPRRSYVIGDKPCDIDLGRNIGATTILVRTGYGRDIATDGQTRADYVADDLRDAARIVVSIVSGA